MSPFNNITIAFNDFVGLSSNNQTFITNGFDAGGGISGGSNWSIVNDYFNGITGNDASLMRNDSTANVTIAGNTVSGAYDSIVTLDDRNLSAGGEFAGITHISGDQRSLAGTNIFEGSDSDDNLLGSTGDDDPFGLGGTDVTPANFV